jgi:hypothetical protein
MKKYTREDITNGLECWLNPDSDIWCEDCAFRNESEGGECKLAVLREAKKIIERSSQDER